MPRALRSLVGPAGQNELLICDRLPLRPADPEAILSRRFIRQRDGRPRAILFNLSGHGFLDIGAYARKGNFGPGLFVYSNEPGI